ncbi:MAG: class I SAM-dependent methyltransferase [Anaerolineae bacterium]|nr:class I SAM-dependent methyltransferase [Anaerolineae bacterium]HPD40684.1 class I SAM-dependent methyltransferase [Anaerolineae bacterium]
MKKDARTTGVAPELYDEAYFLHACEGYAEFTSTEGAELSRRLAAAWRVAGVAPGMTILDVGCGRGEILRHVAALGARAVGVDYAPAAVRMSRRVGDAVPAGQYPVGVYRADAKHLPFPDAGFDRVLMLDIVEHLYPPELDQAVAETFRVLRPGGRLVVHTAPNVWYDRYAYPVVRTVRRLMGQGAAYPRNPREFLVPENARVHVNEQSLLSLRRVLQRAGFHDIRVWLSSPPQQRREGAVLGELRHFLFGAPPFRWFFEREIFAVGEK